MASVSRTREIDAAPEKVWRLVANPYNFPRWWPRVQRVEAVDESPGGDYTRWTKVFTTQSGRGVRADYRRIEREENREFGWAQELADSPFAKHLKSSETRIVIEPDESRCLVTIRTSQRLRGLSRLGSWMMRRAGKRLADEALDGLEEAVGHG